VLTEQNIEAELSYAYLHAVATRAGFACAVAGRHLDDVSVDALIHESGRRLHPNSRVLDLSLHVQLKATRTTPPEQDGRFSFSLPLHQYNRLRETLLTVPRLLVVYLLPSDPAEWLRHSEEGLIARRCAYWVSLRGAPPSLNETTQTVYVPRSQPLSPDGLLQIMTRLSRLEEIPYEV
jgi:hypothetical protein